MFIKHNKSDVMAILHVIEISATDRLNRNRSGQKITGVRYILTTTYCNFTFSLSCFYSTVYVYASNERPVQIFVRMCGDTNHIGEV